MKTAVKIKSQEPIVTSLNGGKGEIQSYPHLPKRHYLVACIGEGNPNVFAIYSLEQINRMQAMLSAGQIHHLNWMIIEIPEELEASLSDPIKSKL
ncbi:MAG: hypothetical protein HWD61_11325 [Parachlamydiaceae bacterium]|nr:MAG: hypothetical protein HWD61_11325 [Parachlamydiaceae bacterium]